MVASPPAQVPARGREREHLLAAAGLIFGEEATDEIGFEGGDEGSANVSGGQCGDDGTTFDQQVLLIDGSYADEGLTIYIQVAP